MANGGIVPHSSRSRQPRPGKDLRGHLCTASTMAGSGRVVVGEDLGGAVAADEVDVVGLALCLWPHAGGAVGHARHGKAAGVGAFGQQAADVGGWDVAFDQVAVDAGGVARDHFWRDAVVHLVPDQRPIVRVLRGDGKPVARQDVDPSAAATAVTILEHMDFRRGGIQRAGQGGQGAHGEAPQKEAPAVNGVGHGLRFLSGAV